MLVLSRKQNQNISFPNLGISIEILRVDGKTVRIGIEAPKEVRVLRGELVDADTPTASGDRATSLVSSNSSGDEDRKRVHDLRNQLNSANLALHVIQKQLERGMVIEAEQTLSQAVESLSQLNQLAQEPVSVRESIQAGAAKGQSDDQCSALVVEDNPNERELLAGFLELCGYKVDVVEDGAAAMEYLAKTQPDIVLLDMQMPRMDGPSTIAAIRSNPLFENIKLFAVSGSDQESLGVQQGAQGIDRWFSKPIKPGDFAKDLASEVSRPPTISA